MPIRATRPPESSCNVLVCRGACAALRRRMLLATRILVLPAPLLFGVVLAAQQAANSASETTPRATHPASHAHRKAAAQKPAPAPALALAPAPPTPAAPQMPNWPVNDKPGEATVVWDSRGLLIEASNSSLNEILQEVSLKTGAQVEGMGADERVFGSYGPGPARDVISQILDGAGYNVLMVGDQGEGTPRRIVLSGRTKGAAQPSGNGTPENDSDQETQQISEQEPPQPGEQQRPGMPGYNPAQPVPVRTPQQIMEQRQQWQQLQQSQQPQQNPQN